MQQIFSKTYPMIFLAILITASIGCQYSRNTSNSPTGYATRPNFDPPPTDAYALSGGKITNFIPKPGLPSDPADQSLLQACQLIKLPGHTARSAYVVITHRGEKPVISALVIGSQVLIIVEDIERQIAGISFGNNNGQKILYSDTSTKITLTAGSRWAKVGNARVLLKTPVVQLPDTHEFVMTLPDMMTLFKIRDAQRGHNIHDVRDAKVIYNLPPMGHF